MNTNIRKDENYRDYNSRDMGSNKTYCSEE